jgi:hypothetical protein
MSDYEVREARKRADRDRMLAGAIAGFCAVKLHKIDKGLDKTNQQLETANNFLAASSQNLHQLNSTASALLGVADQQLVVQEQISETLTRLDANNAAQLRVQKSSLGLQQKQLKLQELQLEAQLARDTRDEARFRESEIDRKRLTAVKDAIHRLNRQASLIDESDYTFLEKCFSADQLVAAVDLISPDDFEEITDKQYRDETERAIKSQQRQYKSAMTQEETADYAQLKEIEAVDEDAIAAQLLQNCKIKPSKNPILEEVKKAVDTKTELDQKTTDRLLKKLETLSAKLQKSGRK